MGKKVIVVDDSSTIRQVLAATLSAAGFEVVEASDGLEGVRTIDAHPDASMVLCDINMPKMTGVQMLVAVKANPKHVALPIVMLTTEGDPAMVKEARAAGARGWIAKPFKPDMLLATVRKLTAA
jgi:two-component system, chemotaxis family, chemotaxis protein CheY